ncbi:MAG: hypothetical protein IT572_09435 [Deltaproteobacteria bacterium]|nr:hypothetical protein [Deltaproteobacteria bacterium]
MSATERSSKRAREVASFIFLPFLLTRKRKNSTTKNLFSREETLQYGDTEKSENTSKLPIKLQSVREILLFAPKVSISKDSGNNYGAD